MTETREDRRRLFTVYRTVAGVRKDTLVSREPSWQCAGKMRNTDIANRVATACRVLTGKPKGTSTAAMVHIPDNGPRTTIHVEVHE